MTDEAKADELSMRYMGKPWDDLSDTEIEQCLELAKLDTEMTQAYVEWLQVKADRYDEMLAAGLTYLEAYANHWRPLWPCSRASSAERSATATAAPSTVSTASHPQHHVGMTRRGASSPPAPASSNRSAPTAEQPTTYRQTTPASLAAQGRRQADQAARCCRRLRPMQPCPRSSQGGRGRPTHSVTRWQG
ncbi:HNH endonuclease domain protein [Rhodococcus sp. MTM3W5.2]|nr:HNH endonuclease domain protein [Rhodococcus sp. MTM3W5.2]